MGAPPSSVPLTVCVFWSTAGEVKPVPAFQPQKRPETGQRGWQVRLGRAEVGWPPEVVCTRQLDRAGGKAVKPPLPKDADRAGAGGRQAGDGEIDREGGDTARLMYNDF